MSRIFGLLQQEFNRLQAMISSGMNKASPISASAQASPATAMLMAPVFRAAYCGLTSNATQIRSSSALNGMVRWNTEEGKKQTSPTCGRTSRVGKLLCFCG